MRDMYARIRSCSPFETAKPSRQRIKLFPIRCVRLLWANAYLAIDIVMLLITPNVTCTYQICPLMKPCVLTPYLCSVELFVHEGSILAIYYYASDIPYRGTCESFFPGHEHSYGPRSWQNLVRIFVRTKNLKSRNPGCNPIGQIFIK